MQKYNRFFNIFFVGFKFRFIFAPAYGDGTLAQLVEQWTENPCVPGSIPGGTTFLNYKTLQINSLQGFCF